MSKYRVARYAITLLILLPVWLMVIRDCIVR
jgi:hypothetical protein